MTGIRVSYLVLVFAAAPVTAGTEQPSGENCSFRVDPDFHLQRAARERRDVTDRTKGAAAHAAGDESRLVPPRDIPRRNFIDEEVFGELEAAKVGSAPVIGDEQFLRRVSLDLTGQLPDPDAVRAFVASSDTGKRGGAIDRLLYSQEFIDKWTMWLGDLFQNNAVQTNITRQLFGRNAFHAWIKASVANEKTLKDIAYEGLTASGNNFDDATGAVNLLLGGRATMGPVQDIYDLMLQQTAERFLGMAHYDCVLCHDGRRHLEQLSLWGTGALRLDAQRMAAFFSRLNIVQSFQQDRASFYFNSFDLRDRPTGNYALSTNFGNRPNREPIGALRAVNAVYRDGREATSADWRAEFATNLVNDPLFAMNFANRIWKAMFGYGLVEPVDSLDPARLDPSNPPPAPWKLQASHPRLLARLGAELAARNFNLREFIRVVSESSAYQLSSRYDGTWNVAMVPLFPRHYPRRLEGEEIHDALVRATGISASYAVTGWAETAQWAMKLPEPVEPRANGAAANFMNNFLRGNRDTQLRSQAGSIVQRLAMMNDPFVANRLRVNDSPTLRAISRMGSSAEKVDELFLRFLSRLPSARERVDAVAHLDKALNPAMANSNLEDLAWALVNKAEFIFSY